MAGRCSAEAAAAIEQDAAARRNIDNGATLMVKSNAAVDGSRSTGGFCEGASVVDNAGTTCPASNLRIALQIHRAATLVGEGAAKVEQCTAGLGPDDGAAVGQFATSVHAAVGPAAEGERTGVGE